MLPVINKNLTQNEKLINSILINELSENTKINTLSNLNNYIQNNVLNNNQTHDQNNESVMLSSCFGNASTSTFVNANTEIYECIKSKTPLTTLQNELININNENELHSISNSSLFSIRFGEKLSAVAEKISSKFVNLINLI